MSREDTGRETAPDELPPVFWEVHSPATLPRQGPGLDSCTSAALRDVLRALGVRCRRVDDVAEDLTPASDAVAAVGSTSAAHSSSDAASAAFDLSGETPLAVLDIGCGPGTQTRRLARDLSPHNLYGRKCSITAVDKSDHLLAVARERHALALSSSEATLAGGDDATASQPMCDVTWANESMFELPFEDGQFDILWAEGAIYISGGIEAGLSTWSRFLKPGGAAAVTEITWLTGASATGSGTDGVPPPPTAAELETAGVAHECADFWTAGYPPMHNVDGNVARGAAAGFACVAASPLPAAAWWAPYYDVISANIARLRAKHAGDADALAVLDSSAQEIQLCREHGKHFNYVFFVFLKKAGAE